MYIVYDYSPKAYAVMADRVTALSDEFSALGGRFNSRPSFGAGWVFSKRVKDSLRAVLESFGCPWEILPHDAENAPKRTKTRETVPGYVCPEDYRKKLFAIDPAFYCKLYPATVALSDGRAVNISALRANLETEFCFGYDEHIPGDYEEARRLCNDARNNGDYFTAYNTAPIRDLIDVIERGETDGRYIWLQKHKALNCWAAVALRIVPGAPLHSLPYCHASAIEEGTLTPVTNDDDLRRIFTGAKYALDKQEKRVSAYLKRYGTAKLRCWTYSRND